MNSRTHKRSINILSKQYLAIVYLVQPFYSDTRGETIRVRVRKILSINRQEEGEIIDKLLKDAALQRAGELLIIGDRPDIKREISLFLDKNKSYFDRLFNEFII